MNTYNFSACGYTRFEELHNAIMHIGRLAETPFTTTGVGKALDSIRFADLAELGLGTRKLVGEIFDEIYVVSAFQKKENNLRLQMLDYLAANDRNGIYTDDDLIAEGYSPITFVQATHQVHCLTVEG